MAILAQQDHCCRARDLLGKLPTDPSVKQLQRDSSLLYKIVEDKERKMIAVQTAKEKHTAEELVVSLVSLARWSYSLCATITLQLAYVSLMCNCILAWRSDNIYQ